MFLACISGFIIFAFREAENLLIESRKNKIHFGMIVNISIDIVYVTFEYVKYVQSKL